MRLAIALALSSMIPASLFAQPTRKPSVSEGSPRLPSPLPDLVIESLSAGPPSVIPGGALSVSSLVRNQGELSSPTFEVRFYLSDDELIDASDYLVGKRTIHNLGIGSGSAQSFPYTLDASLPLGHYHFGALCDEPNAVLESDENNNTFLLPIQIEVYSGQPPAPDLTITQLSFDPSELPPGGQLQLFSLVRNIGDLDAESYRIDYFTSDDSIVDTEDIFIGGGLSTPSLAAGAESPDSIQLDLPAEVTTGFWYVGGIVSILSGPSDSYEENNSRVADSTLEVVIPVDCNSNGVPDDLDLSSGTSSDCDTNGVPDECDLDCDSNGVPDACELASNPGLDCDSNGTLDSCEIAANPTLDYDQNGVLDVCECLSANYCLAAGNTNGTQAIIGWQGALSVLGNDFVLTVTGAPPLKPAIFFYGATQTQVILGEGVICVGGQVQRLQPLILTDQEGAAILPLDFTSPPFAGGPFAVAPLSTWNFQFWYRDPLGGPAGFNFSDGLEVTFCP